MKYVSMAFVALLGLAGAARAQVPAAPVFGPVMPGCVVPAAVSGAQTWYVDPVNGKTQAAGATGSAASPFNSLQAIVGPGVVAGYTSPLLNTVPWRHVVNGTYQTVPNPAAPVHPGDTIVLMSGNYGNIDLGAFGAPVVNSSFVTIKAGPGQTPVATQLFVYGATEFSVSGLKVQSLASAGEFGLVYVASTSHDIIISGNDLSSADDSVTASWTAAQWQANARQGFEVRGLSEVVGDTTPSTTYCVSFLNNIVHNTTGTAIIGDTTLYSGNEVYRNTADFIDYRASNVQITNNYLHDSINVNTATVHYDFMQGQTGSGTGTQLEKHHDIVIHGNRMIRQIDPALSSMTGGVQGIDAFDGNWSNITITDNTIITSSCWGISHGATTNMIIANNTVLADGWQPASQTFTCYPQIVVGGSTHEDPTGSHNVVARNNIADELTVNGTGFGTEPDTNLSADHNLLMQKIVTTTNGVTNFNNNMPGHTYGDHNLISPQIEAQLFNSFAATTATPPAPTLPGYDLTLRSGSTAIGQGTTVGIQTDDLTGAPWRTDAGAYTH